MEGYKHLTQMEREKIAILKNEGMGVRFIADTMADFLLLFRESSGAMRHLLGSIGQIGRGIFIF